MEKLKLEKDLLPVLIRLNQDQKKWLIKEANKWRESQSQIIRSLINSRLEYNENKQK